MIYQKWTVTVDETAHDVEYICKPMLGKTELCVDGVSFTVQGKPLGIGLVRREMVMVGGVQGILDVKKGGKADLIVREAEVKKII